MAGEPQRVRIAFMGIKGLPSRFGADRVVESLVGQLADRHEITVYACRAMYPERPTFSSFRQVYVPSLPGKHLRMASVMVFAAFHALLRGRYDLIHLHNLETGFVVPLLRLRFPVVVTSHGWAHLIDKWSGPARTLMRWFEELALRSASAVTAVSKPQAISYHEETGRPVTWVPNGIRHPLPCDHERGREALRQAGAPEEGFVLFMAGRIIPMKGCHLLLEACRRLGRDVALVVVGDETELPEYAAELRALAGSRTYFLGFVGDPATLFGLASRARLFVFPSTIEAMSMALLEVASLGIPALVSDIPANRAVLDERHATFFRSGDVADLAQKLAACLDGSVELAVKARAAQTYVRDAYAWPRIAARYEEVYRSATAR